MLYLEALERGIMLASREDLRSKKETWSPVDRLCFIERDLYCGI